MPKYLKNKLVDIAVLLFIINTVSALSVIAFLLVWEVLAIAWIVLGVTVLLLLLASCAFPMGNKTNKRIKTKT